MRNVPSLGGKIAFRSLMMRGALATIRGKHDAVDGAGADAIAQRIQQHGAIEAQQPAHARSE